MDAQSAVKARRQREAEHILAQLGESLPNVLRQYPVDAAYIYGSVARGTVMPSSDVDIALLLTAPLPAYERLKLELGIQAEVESACSVAPVDVRVINDAPLTVRGRIVQQGILLYERDRARRVTFEVATRKRYFDFAPVARSLRDAFLQRAYQKGLLRG